MINSITLPDFSKATILVVGDLMLDSYWHGATNRISPEAPVPVVNVNQQESRAGGAANVAMNIATLGAHASVSGLTGNDENAKTLEQILASLNVRCFFEAVAEKPTITKLRIFSRHQQLLRLDFEENFQLDSKESLLKTFSQLLSGYKAVVFSDYAKGTLSDVQSMIQQCNALNIPSLVDPKGTDFERYRGATLLTPNLAEFEAVVGKIYNEEQLVRCGMELIEKYQLQALLVTRSEQGMTLLRKGHSELHLPTQAQEVFDVTGAGDTVIATFACTLAAGHSFEEASILANTAAGIAVSKLGTSTVTAVELNEMLHDVKQAGYGVLTEDLLVTQITLAKKQGKRIVMTNGCFDILHAGHVAYLEEAAQLGDYLIVAVNDDSSVKRLKGEGRPVNQVERRMAVLNGLSSVSWVVPFSEDTPERLIKLLTPDILVKGGDYTIDGVVGGDWVVSQGGIVKVLQFKENCSTTDIITRIQTSTDEE